MKRKQKKQLETSGASNTQVASNFAKEMHFLLPSGQVYSLQQ